MSVNEPTKSIALDFLYDGMMVKDDIFDHTGAVALLRAGETLDEHKIDRLRKFNSGNNNIKVSAKMYDELVEKWDADSAANQQELEQKTGYTSLKEDTNQILTDIRISHKVNPHDIDSMKRGIVSRLDTLSVDTIFQCINGPRPMDEYLQRHCINVGFLNGLLGKWLRFSKERIATLVLAGIVHDVGKTRIPLEILDAPRKLTAEEFEIIKAHPVYSFEMLCEDPAFENEVRIAAKYHHERIAGGGYPEGLEGKHIPEIARITAVSDVYDAMVSRRSYKRAHNPLKILDRFAKREFDHLDPTLIDVFVPHMIEHMIGKEISFEDGTLAEIVHIMPHDICYPIVRIGEKLYQTDESFGLMDVTLFERHNVRKVEAD